MSPKTTTFFRFLYLPVLIGCFSACNRPAYRTLAPPWEPPYPVDRFEASIRKYEADDAAHSPAAGSIVLTGSSSFALWKTAEEDLLPLKVLNRGFGGSTFPEVIHYLDRTVLKYHPSAIVVYCENDLFSGKPKTPEQTRDEYVRLVQKIREKLPDTRIYYLSMKPSPSRWKQWEEVKKTNRLIRDFVKKDRHQEYIDITRVMLKNGRPDGSLFLKDSLHMNEEGYRRWITVLKPRLSVP